MNIKRWWRRRFHPTIICEFAEDIEDGAVRLQPNIDDWALLHWPWRGTTVVIHWGHKGKWNTEIANATFGGDETRFLHRILINSEKKEKSAQEKADRKEAQQQVLVPLKTQIRSQSLELASLEKLLIREIRHLIREISIAQSDLRHLAGCKEATTDHYRRLELINARIACLRTGKETFANQLREVRQLHQQAKEQMSTTNLPLPEEVLGSCQQVKSEILTDQVAEELRATKAALAALKTA